MTSLKLFLILCLSSVGIIVIPLSGHCYVGPGAGITLIGSLWAVLVAIVLALFGILSWPIRRLLRRRKAKKADLVESKVKGMDLDN